MKALHNRAFSLYQSAVILMILSLACATQLPAVQTVAGGQISIEFDDQLHSRIVSGIAGKPLILGDFCPSEFITVDGFTVSDFRLLDRYEKSVQDRIGTGTEFHLTASGENLKKEVCITRYDDFPTMLFMQVSYTNTGEIDLTVDNWTNHHYTITTSGALQDSTLFWSYQPGSYGWSNDWVRPLKKGFTRENYMGMNHVDYGGGTPVVDIWRADVGLAVGHVEPVPKLVSLPVTVPDENGATMEITFAKSKKLKPGEKLSTFRTFVAVHTGDHFQTLSEYSRFMVRNGIEFRDPPESVYETIWCGWGYEKNFTMEQFTNTFPKVRELGLDWIVLDYGWDTGVGDYYLPEDKFPNGDADMRQLVEDIHALGAKAKLWWMPLSVYPCTDMFTQHPQYLLLNEDRSPRYIQFWRSFFLCPAFEEVRQLSREFVIKAIRDWGYDGLKIDGNNLNNVPPCYNRAHRHAFPEESVEKLPEFFKMIFETVMEINPNAVVEICPCGTTYSFYILPYMNQSVASDPSNSWQIRLKGKTLKALTGPKVAFYGDHVELSDDKSDFASTVGIGGVIGTKFVWPVGVHMNRESGDVSLTPEKEREWGKWIRIYKDKMLPRGDYRGELYDIGYDRPEAHAISKNETMYYAFYAPRYDGDVELRGLAEKSYGVTDYVNDRQLGTVRGPLAKLKVSFQKHLLLEVKPR